MEKVDFYRDLLCIQQVKGVSVICKFLKRFNCTIYSVRYLFEVSRHYRFVAEGPRKSCEFFDNFSRENEDLTKVENFSLSLIDERLDEHQNEHQNAYVMGVVCLKISCHSSLTNINSDLLRHLK